MSSLSASRRRYLPLPLPRRSLRHFPPRALFCIPFSSTSSSVLFLGQQPLALHVPFAGLYKKNKNQVFQKEEKRRNEASRGGGKQERMEARRQGRRTAGDEERKYKRKTLETIFFFLL